MDIIKHYVIILIAGIWFHLFEIHSLELPVDHTGVTWQKARNLCGSQGLEYRKDELSRINDSLSEFWIGLAVYKSTSSWMELKGCWCMPQTFGTRVKVMRNIVICKHRCRDSEYFAYKNKTCLCLNKTDVNLHSNPIDCTGSYQHSEYYIFVYTHFHGEYNQSGNGNCMTTIPRCDNSPVQLQQKECGLKSGDIHSLCGDGSEPPDQQWALTYEDSLTKCLQRNQILASSTGICFNNNKLPVWTNVFRRTEEVVRKPLNDNHQYQEPISCIVAKWDTSNARKPTLITKRQNCSFKLRYYACRSSSHQEEHMSTPHALITTRAGSLTDKESTSLETATHNENQMTTSQVLISNRPNTDTSHESTSLETGTIVGGIIGVIVLFVVIAVIVCRIRSVGIFQNVNKKSHEDFVSNEILNAPRMPSERSDTNSIGNTGSNATYAQVMKPDRVLKLSNTIINNEKTDTSVPIQFVSDQTYAHSGNDEYDLLNDADRRKICLKENLYDSASGFRNTDDPTYNISGPTFTKRKEESNTYISTNQKVYTDFS